MKLASFRTPDGLPTFGLLVEKNGRAGFVDLGRRSDPATLRAFLETGGLQGAGGFTTMEADFAIDEVANPRLRTASRLERWKTLVRAGEGRL